MDNLQVYSVSAINTLSASYYDPFYQFKQYREGYEQGFSLNNIYALNDVVDNTINNHTSQYLTSKKNLNEIFTINGKDSRVETITTQLIFNVFKNTQQPKLLYLYSNTINFDPRVTACRVLSQELIGIKNNTYFELEIIDDLFLRVKHNNGKNDYYLNYIPGQNNLYFLNYYSDINAISAERNDMFRYVLDTDGFLQLFKNTSTGSKVLTLTAANDSFGGDILTLVDVTSGTIARSSDSIIKIDYSIKNIIPKSYSSWISYDITKQNNLSINRDKSLFEREDQYLIHGNVNEADNDITLNYITLNNIRSEKNYIKRGTNIIDGSPYLPAVEFREYMSLQTGNSQELGNDNIALTYVWYDKDIKIKNGADTIFVAPSSIYPYSKLNINDTKFVENGSLAGLTPKLADNIYQLRKNNTVYNNGRYLITWLSGGGDIPGLWVDRYYYPDYITKREALEGIPVYNPSFGDPVDSINFTDPQSVAANAFFDKKSDLCLEPNCTYKYSRVGVDDITDYITTTNPLVSTFNNYYTVDNVEVPYTSNEILYDGLKYNKFEVMGNINKTNAFTVSFDLFVDPQGSFGYQIFGNNTDKGFGVFNDTKITPFVFSYGDSALKVYNTDLELLYTTVFDTSILDIIKGNGLDDYYVICSGARIYRVNTLGVKLKMKVVPEIVGYVNYYFDGSYIYFVNNSATSDVVKIDKETLQLVETLTSKKFKSYENYPVYNGKQSIVLVNGDIYQLPGREIKHITPTVVYYTINGEVLVRHDLISDDITSIIQSKTSIIDFAVDKESIFILHDNNKLSIYTLDLDLITSQDMSNTLADLSILVSIDLIKQYTGVASNKLDKDIVITYLDNNSRLNILTISNLNSVNTDLKGYPVDEFSNSRVAKGYIATNYSYFNQTETTNSISFNLTLTNYLSTEDIAYKNILFDYTTLDKGYHTFTYRFDPIQGNITLFVDGVKYTNLTVQPGKYVIQNTLNDNLYAGTAGFYNNTDLATYLRQPGYYYLNNTRLKNVFIYNRALRDDEISCLNIYDTQINDLVLSIPAGQRNNIEEIERYFKFKPKDSSSNKINIVVKNANISDTNLQENIKNLILSEAASILPVGVNIYDIQFINFK